MTNDFDICDEVLISLRRVIRAVDIHSRSLINSHGLTGPQTLILKEISKAQVLTAGEIAKRVTLSQATVTDILNRLEKRNLISKNRSDGDRRKVLISATPKAIELLQKSPPLLQERFILRFKNLHDWEQSQLLSSLQRIAELMDAEDIDAAPVLSSGAVTTNEKELSTILNSIEQQAGNPKQTD